MRGFLAAVVGLAVVALYLTWGLGMLLSERADAGVNVGGAVFILAPVVVGVVARRVVARRRRVEREDRLQRLHEARLELTRAEQPELWELVERTARACRAVVPESVELHAGAGARVLRYGPAQRPRLMLGVPLLLGMDVDELTAVLGHEFGHVRRGPHLRLARRSDERRLRRRLRLALARREELACDATGALVAGPAAMASALRALAEWGWAEHRYTADYLQPGVAAGVRPRELYRGLAALFADPSRADERAAHLRAVLDGREDPRHTHPGLSRRLDALARRSGARSVPADGRPALELLRGADGVLDRAAELLLDRDIVKARPLDWAEYFHTAGRIANSRVALPVSVRVGGAGDLGRVVGLWENGGLPDLAVQAVALDALAAAGHVRWVADWAAPLRAVRADGSPLPEGDAAALVALIRELRVPVNHVPVFG
ncbi:M48 family metallopeptidase [Streptacidiphilus jiangxiensis]|uniref:Zn-dependent protease with chaperone function n=1 Tax=Streptacidiphilus jiangxiensis TaxID=235985 RepID=A0A1H7XRX4_STRJI|nr:M48 family metallopeptidase [Streptacidiphilus jiangxiensis]SEM36530.1 Zn-dependent protease with chaperone function [Streptacidiphilus jiangxiensis]